MPERLTQKILTQAEIMIQHFTENRGVDYSLSIDSGLNGIRITVKPLAISNKYINQFNIGDDLAKELFSGLSTSTEE